MASVIFSVILLVAVYLMTLASGDPWDIAIGAAVAVGTLYAFRRHLARGPGISAGELLRRTIAFVPFTWAVIVTILIGTFQVAQIVLHLAPLRRPGIVAVPIEERTPLGVAVSSLATTLSPGTFLVDVDWEKGVMLIHSIDASDPAKVRDDHQVFYRRYQRRVFP